MKLLFKQFAIYQAIILLCIPILISACKNKKGAAINENSIAQNEGMLSIPFAKEGVRFDSIEIVKFIKKYPSFKAFQKQFDTVYVANEYKTVWQDEDGLKELTNKLVARITSIDEEGIVSSIPYKDAFFEMIQKEQTTSDKFKTDVEMDLMITGQYFNFIKQVYAGKVSGNLEKINWFLPSKKFSYVELLHKNITDTLIKGEGSAVERIPQYAGLKKQLSIYNELSKKYVNESVIPSLTRNKPLKFNDTAYLIPILVKRIFELGYQIKLDTSKIYSSDLISTINIIKPRYGLKPDSLINSALIKELNVPIKKRIEQVIVNMERFRWIPKDTSSNEFILVNIPEYSLHYYEGNKEAWTCNVVVGALMTKTVIFSGNMQFVVMSPYWYVPQSLINKEVKPGMARNSNYLASHRMEWNSGNVRQLPGPSNSLGLVKFLFPNVNSIYLHDTPSKDLFAKDARAFSHGCVRVSKPRDLAIRVLRQDPYWTEARIDAAMHQTKETTVTLKKHIPVYIGYFTAFIGNDGGLNFRDDIYSRDNKLFKLLSE